MDVETTTASKNIPPMGRIKRSAAADQKGIWRWLPGLYTLRHYRRSWLRNDLMAGLVLTAVLVPVGMGYAEAAGLPAINGLYATIVPLIAYAIFGPSRILVLGPDSSLAAIIAAVIVPLGAGDPARMHPGRPCPPGDYHRAALEADPLRIYEWDRPDGVDRAASQAVRLLHRCRGGTGRNGRIRPGRESGVDQSGHPCTRCFHLVIHPGDKTV